MNRRVSLGKIFSDIGKDISLIRMTERHQFSNDVSVGLASLGWEKTTVKKMHCSARFYNVATLIYDDTIYCNRNNQEGDQKWYKDLASLTMPDHKPGILTKIIG